MAVKNIKLTLGQMEHRQLERFVKAQERTAKALERIVDALEPTLKKEQE